MGETGARLIHFSAPNCDFTFCKQLYTSLNQRAGQGRRQALFNRAPSASLLLHDFSVGDALALAADDLGPLIRVGGIG